MHITHRAISSCSPYQLEVNTNRSSFRKIGRKEKHRGKQEKKQEKEVEETLIGYTDKSTGEKYEGQKKSTIRLKCAALFFGTLTLQPVALTFNALNRIAKIATLAHFWAPSQGEYQFKARLKECGKDLLVVATTPLIVIGMLFSSVYGATVSPLNGRKLYATFERFAYSGGYQVFHLNPKKTQHDHFLAPCFQPNPKSHLGGGEIGNQTAW